MRRAGTPDPDGRCVRVLDAARPAGGRQPGARRRDCRRQRPRRRPVGRVPRLARLRRARQPAALPVSRRGAARTSRRAWRAAAPGSCFAARPIIGWNRFVAEVQTGPRGGRTRTRCARPKAWRQTMAASLRVPLWTVDADVVVPSALLLKEQYAARTIRPRIHARLRRVPGGTAKGPRATVAVAACQGACSTCGRRWRCSTSFHCDRSVGPVRDARAAARRRGVVRYLRAFVRQPARGVRRGSATTPSATARACCRPTCTSDSWGRARWRARVPRRPPSRPAGGADAFLEQLIVRRELAVNFVTFNPRATTAWTAASRGRSRTLARHAQGPPHAWLYTADQLEAAQTHDPLWNAAQRQMVETGWMHGYVRMYWAKKILRMVAAPRRGVRPGGGAERPLSARRARPERLHQHRLGRRRQARSPVAGAAGHRHHPLDVVQQHVAQVRRA